MTTRLNKTQALYLAITKDTRPELKAIKLDKETAYRFAQDRDYDLFKVIVPTYAQVSAVEDLPIKAISFAIDEYNRCHSGGLVYRDYVALLFLSF